MRIAAINQGEGEGRRVPQKGGEDKEKAHQAEIGQDTAAKLETL
jgi:hypothetical protein